MTSVADIAGRRPLPPPEPQAEPEGSGIRRPPPGADFGDIVDGLKPLPEPVAPEPEKQPIDVPEPEKQPV